MLSSLLQEDDSSSDEESAQKAGPDFDYLLGMPMWSLTLERKNELLKKRDDKIQELKALQRKTPSDLWRDDLNAFLEKVKFVVPLLVTVGFIYITYLYL